MIKPLHQLFPKIEAVSKRKRNRVAIGVLRDSPEVRKALEIGSKHADLVIVGKKKIPGFKTIALGEVSDNDYSKAVIDLLQKGKVDAIVRGQVKYGEFEKMFKERKLFEKIPERDAGSLLFRRGLGGGERRCALYRRPVF